MSKKRLHMVVLLSRTISPDATFVLESGQVFAEEKDFIINPPDAISLEEALQLKERYGGHITVVMVSKKEGEKQLRVALAMGADEAVLIECNPNEQAPTNIAKKIKEYIQDVDYDLILAGDFSTDGASSQVGPRLAASLDIPFFTKTIRIEEEEGNALIRRNTDGDIESFRVPFPFLITIPQGLHVPRLPSLAGIMKAKKKPLLFKQSQESLSHNTLSEYSYPQLKRKQTMIQGETWDKAVTLNKLLKSLQ
ncbi:electron transfer flavoprotein subunit beta/FixA family protein [Cytobacillus oceanisediminis]|uniref:Electron transfer flavoprotein subunit beta n=1 Tax=Niallia alba TaxID=2729105 RepID=A0A7Y0KA96_9BACI|nr:MULTISPECIES: electron transfer flavoprotein subunit beta/FixA family protein [Bacillaceae]MBQ6448122.1 electron transfer flavoprotein subunit beta/FixA family protein [Bacillus sp. (in: firmicutes)]MBZ9535443.1 electron transfer flavoprotein subunit beta/FixA family protein [Cytobacillus oceanisediminis]NMO78732.1 electron transfer flavoprotein subunit beta/FixA family protein [Niallia alba]